MLAADGRIEERSVYEELGRELRPYLPEFARCRSLAELHALPAYRQAAERVRRLLGTLESGDFAAGAPAAKRRCRVVAWNIERGTRVAGQIAAFRGDPCLREADVILLVESDIGMARSGNVNVSRTIARELGFRYVFAPCYLSLVKGSGVERHVREENDLGLHGNAVLSRYPITDARAIPLMNGMDKMSGREKRLGSQAAVAATIAFPGLRFTAVSVHLDANSSQRHRREQMRSILDSIEGSGPVVLGGDWNTSTYDSSHAFPAIVGFWRRVLMGVDRVIRNHYLHPERWFERGLFRLLEARGFDYRDCNVLGERTTRYDIEDPHALGILGEWVPGWCIPFIRWALREHDGKCPFKLDWFAVRGVRAFDPCVVHEYRELSDHDPVAVDLEAP